MPESFDVNKATSDIYQGALRAGLSIQDVSKVHVKQSPGQPPEIILYTRLLKGRPVSLQTGMKSYSSSPDEAKQSDSILTIRVIQVHDDDGGNTVWWASAAVDALYIHENAGSATSGWTEQQADQALAGRMERDTLNDTGLPRSAGEAVEKALEKLGIEDGAVVPGIKATEMIALSERTNSRKRRNNSSGLTSNSKDGRFSWIYNIWTQLAFGIIAIAILSFAGYLIYTHNTSHKQNAPNANQSSCAHTATTQGSQCSSGTPTPDTEYANIQAFSGSIGIDGETLGPDNPLPDNYRIEIFCTPESLSYPVTVSLMNPDGTVAKSDIISFTCTNEKTSATYTGSKGGNYQLYVNGSGQLSLVIQQHIK